MIKFAVGLLDTKSQQLLGTLKPFLANVETFVKVHEGHRAHWDIVVGHHLLWARRGDGRSDGTARGHQPALGVVVVLDLHNVLALQLAELEHHCGAQLRVRPVPDSEVGEHRHDGLVVRAQKHQLLRLGGVVGVFEASLQRLDALVHEVADDVQGAPPRGAAHGELVVHVVAFELQVVHVASQLLEKRLLLECESEPALVGEDGHVQRVFNLHLLLQQHQRLQPAVDGVFGAKVLVLSHAPRLVHERLAPRVAVPALHHL
mmetsp:Transcript_31895/g.61388  ORF Transcript_31895/g.61388 Transcript_31895/m.61388 type:complete len:260 (-) Transcript_31895:1303-2082(-)